jgi:hypothetical protein
VGAGNLGLKRGKESSGFGFVLAPLPRRHTQTRTDRSKRQSRRLVRAYETRHPRCSAVRLASRNVESVQATRAIVSPANQNQAAVSNPSGSARKRDGQSGEGGMVRYLCEIGDFVRRLRIQARFGELSRAPLQLLRLELRGEIAECDWIARPPDRWDSELPSGAGERHASMQALQDAITVRDLLFRALPDLRSAKIRVYRKGANSISELIISGVVTREEGAPNAVRSLAMRAKMLGLRFWLEEGILESLRGQERGITSGPRNEPFPV